MAKSSLKKLNVNELEISYLVGDLTQTREIGFTSLADPNFVRLFNVRVSLIDETFNKFSKLIEESINIASSIDDNDTISKLNNLRISTKSIYYEALSFKDSVQDYGNIHPLSEGISKEPELPIKLPVINIPLFSGDITSWNSFKDTFTSLIHTNNKLHSVQKFHYLKSSLKGAAAQIISSYSITTDNYLLAWTALCNRYDNKRLQAINYLTKIFNFKPMTKSDFTSLENFSQTVLASANAFFNLKLEDESGFILQTLALRLLDPKTRERFEVEQSSKTTIPTFKEFENFVHKQYTLHQAESITMSTNSQSLALYKSSKSVFLSTSNTSDTCPLCKEKHKLYQCREFTLLNPKQRYNCAKQLRLCINCLQPSHKTLNCVSNLSCRHCNLKHHSYLHFPSSTHKIKTATSDNEFLFSHITSSNEDTDDIGGHSNNTSNEASSNSDQVNISNSEIADKSLLSSSTFRKINVLLGTAVANIQSSDGETFPIRILIDCGSQRSFITSSCAKALGLPTEPNPQPLCGFGDNPIKDAIHQVACTLLPRNNSCPILTVKAVSVRHITDKLPTSPVPESIKQYFEQFELADPQFYRSGKIDFLLGADLFPDILLGESANPGDGFPKALKTIFGWIVMGNINDQQNSNHSAVSMMASTMSNSLDTLVQKFWEVENVPVSSRVNPEDVRCETHFITHYSRNGEGRYIVRLPFKNPNSVNFGDSSHAALQRLKKLEYRLDKSPVLKIEYSKIILDYLKLNFISESTQMGTYYLPHHCVLKNSTTTSVRIVFDASFSTAFGSLNDKLRVGPKLQLDIQHVILNFRQYLYVITADICKMYLQVLVHPEDRQYLHFFYRFNPSDSYKEYEMNRLPFGLSCSPFLAIRTLHQLVADEGSAFPLAAHTLKNCIYVDDILTGADTVDTTLQLQKELIQLLDKGGFTLQKWASNSKELVKHVNPDDKEDSVTFSEEGNSSVKVLGMKWDPNLDCIAYNIHLQTVPTTKRGVLSTVARMYDPLGFLAPVIFKAKSFLQLLWSTKVDWDDPIPLSLAQVWNELFSELHILTKIHVPRCIFKSKDCQKIIVGFADASELGYAAAIYICSKYEADVSETRLLIAKTRLAPLKTLSIPRLELCAALLLTQTYQSIQDFLKTICVDMIYFLSDSTVVLNWLRLPPHTLKIFVANRVVNILENSNVNDWYHVSSEDNAADIASRGIMPSLLLNHSLWWNGPIWLNKPPSDWPISKPAHCQVPEIKSNNVVLVNNFPSNNFIDEIGRFSSYTKLIRTFAYVLRFVDNLKNRSEKRSGSLKLNEIEEAKCVLIKSIQTFYFNLDVPFSDNKNSSLQSLSPFIDTKKIVRVGGRLTNSPLNEQAKHPILLPYRSHFSKLLIDYYHKCYLHAGPQLLYSLIQRKFWIISGRRLIKSRIYNCKTCFRFCKKTFTPYMGDLPPTRFEQGRCFINTGVDFAGPFLTKDSNRRKPILFKSYLALFVCLSTKAVHFEIVSQLSTDCFLACLDRFIARRGLPSKILSDHGTNFIGANRHLRDLYGWFKTDKAQQSVMDHLHIKGISWEFIPPAAPHFGGLWEAGVKSFKHHLFRVLNGRTLTFEELSTLTCKIEAILNSRPLYPLSNEPNEYDVLTPGHFLIGAPMVSLPERNLIDISINRLTRWQFLQQCIQHIWARWRRDYLNSLQQRVKWKNSSENIMIDSLVLLKDSKVSPLQWPTARVIETYPGSDGVIRVVKIKTPNGEYIRPVSKLAPLLPTNNP